MNFKFYFSIRKICKSSVATVLLLFSINNYAYDECVSINSYLVEEICYENLGDYRTDNDEKQWGFRPSELPQDITDYGIYFHFVDRERVPNVDILDPNYKLYYDHNLGGHTLYLQDNKHHDITFKFKGEKTRSERIEVCNLTSILRVTWVFLKHFWGFFSDPFGTWKIVLAEIEIVECKWQSASTTHDFEEQHNISIDVPINTAHAVDAIKIELDENHMGDQSQFKVTTTYPHATEGTVTLSTIADESSESIDIHHEIFVLSLETPHFLQSESLDKDHLAANITTTAMFRVGEDEKNVSIHDDLINHHRRLQEIQLINSLDDMGLNCQHPTQRMHRTQDDNCLLQSTVLSEASNDFYNMVVRPEQQARYDSWDSTGNATVVKTKISVDYSRQDDVEGSPPTNRYHVYDNGIARCKVTADLNQRDFPALTCHVDGYEHHALQIDYDHRRQDFDAHLVTAEGAKPLSEIELESLLHHSWQDWIVGDLSDQYDQRTHNYNQQLSPILSGDGITEFLLALESWEVWGQYQRFIESMENQLIVTDALDSTYQIRVEETAVEPLTIGPLDDLYYSTEAFMDGSITQEEYKNLLIHAFTIPLKPYRDSHGRSYTVDDQTGEWYTLDNDNNRILINPNNLTADEFLIHYDQRGNTLHFKNAEYKTATWMPDYHLHYLHAPRSIDSRYGVMRFTTMDEILLYEYFIEQMESRGSEVYMPEGAGSSQVNDRASAIQDSFAIKDIPLFYMKSIKGPLNSDKASQVQQQLQIKEKISPKNRYENYCRDLEGMNLSSILTDDVQLNDQTPKAQSEAEWIEQVTNAGFTYACWTIVPRVNDQLSYTFRLPVNLRESQFRIAVDCDWDNTQMTLVSNMSTCLVTRADQKITIFYAVSSVNPSLSFQSMHEGDQFIKEFRGTMPYSNLAESPISIRNYSRMFRQAIYLSNVQLQTSQAEDMSSMFAMYTPAYATTLTGNFSSWDVHRVNSMSYMFAGESDFIYDANTANAFNQDISNWDLTSATDLSYMFTSSKFNNGQEALSDNRPLNWADKVRNVQYTIGMFMYNKSYNQPMRGWQFFRLQDASHMFNGTIFNQNISLWEFADPNVIFDDHYDGDGSSLRRMDYMFAFSEFNNGRVQGSSFPMPFRWTDQVSNVTSARGLFKKNRIFNQAMDNWDFENLIDGSEMFSGARSFDQDLSGWKLSSLQSANEMFRSASGFKGSLRSWDLSHIQDFDQQSNRRNFYRHSPHLENNQNDRPIYYGAPLD